MEISLQYKDTGIAYDGAKATNAKAVVSYMKEAFSHRPDQEQFWIVLVNVRLEIIGRNMVSLGTLDSCLFHPRDVFKPAILQSAHGVIAVHQHPSGCCEPSVGDIKATSQLSQAGDVLGISLLDHVIIGDDCYYSFAERQGLG